jgi:hypothetical protein
MFTSSISRVIRRSKSVARSILSKAFDAIHSQGLLNKYESSKFDILDGIIR